jgi:hypothetical protein
MGNIFLAGYFTSVTLDKLFEKKWGLAAMYGTLTALNIVLALTTIGE